MPEMYRAVKRPKKRGRKEVSVNYLKQTSAYQQRKQPMGRNMLEDLQSLFRVLQGLEFEVPRQIVLLGVAVDSLQTLAFSFNPHMRGSNITQSISKAVYFFQLPVWDDSLFSAGYLATMIVTWVYTAIVAIVVLEILYRVRQSTEYSTSPFHAKLLVSIFGSFMFLPVFQHVLSMIVCDDEGNLASFPSETCREGVGILRMVGAVIGGGLSLVITCLANLFLFNVNPQSRHRLARFHCRCDILNIAYRIACCILFHWALSSQNLDTYFAYLAVSSMVLSFSWMFFIPYYSEDITFYRVATLWLNTFFACTNLAMDSDVEPSTDLPILIIGGIIVVIAAYKVYDIRVSRQFKSDVRYMQYQNVFPQTTFPKGLPGVPNHVDMWTCFLELGCLDESTKSEHLTGSLVTPYVSSISIATDCELACRFARSYVNLTGYALTANMIRLGCEIYIRGLHRFKNDPDLLLGFALFLCHYRRREGACKELSGYLMETDCSLFVRYQAFKLDQTVKVDSTHLERYESAKTLHKGCLQSKIDFWKILIPEDYDKLMLDSKARLLAEQSEQALNEYLYALRLGDSKRTLHTTDIRMILHYGQYFEQVLQAKDIANRCFAVSSEHLKLRESKQLRGAKRKAANEIGIAHLPTAEEARSVEEQGQQNNMQSSGRDTIIHAARMLNAVFVCLLILLFGFLCITVITTENRKDVLKSVDSVSKVRSYTEQATLIVELMETSQQKELSWHQGMHSKLADVVEALHTNLNLCMWGDMSPSFSKLRPILVDPHYRILNYVGTSSYATLESTWTLGYRTAEMLYSYMMRPVGQNYTNSPFMTDPDLVGDVLNRTSSLFNDWDALIVDTSVQILVISYGASALLVTVVFVMLTLKFNAVERSKKSIRNFVTLIPKEVVIEHHAQAVEALKHFEKYLRRPERLLSLDIENRQFGNTSPSNARGPSAQVGFYEGQSDNASSVTRTSKATTAKEEKSNAQSIQAAIAAEKQLKEATNQESRSSLEKGPLYASQYVKVLLYLITALMVAQLPLILTSRAQFGESDEELGTFYAMRSMKELINDIAELYVDALDFLEHPKDQYARYRKLHIKSAIVPNILEFTSRYPDQGFSSGVTDVSALSYHYLSGMKLAVLAYNYSVSDMPLVDRTWVSGTSSFVIIEDYTPLSPPLRELSTNTIDEQADDLLQLARSHLSWDYTATSTLHLIEKWWEKKVIIGDASMNSIDDLTKKAELSQRIEVALNCLIILAMFLISLEHARAPLIRNRIRTACLVVSFALTAANLGMGITELRQVPEIREHSETVFHNSELPLITKEVTILSAAASQFGELKYFQNVQKLFSVVLETQRDEVDEYHLFVPPLSEKLAKISLVLIGEAFNLTEHLKPEIRSFSWDAKRDSELSYLENILHNRTYIMSLPIDELMHVMRQTTYLSNVEMTMTSNAASKYLDDLADSHIHTTHDLIAIQQVFRVQQVLILSAALLCLAIFYLSVFIAAVAIKDQNEKYDANQLGMSLGVQIEKMSYALGLVFLLITGTFALSLIRLKASENAVSRIAMSASREWLLSSSMLRVNRIAHSYVAEDLYTLELLVDNIRTAHHDLYFHHKETSSFNGVGIDSMQDRLLFGYQVQVPDQYDPNSGCAIRDQHIREILTYGLHSAMEKWTSYCQAVLSLAREDGPDKHQMILAVSESMELQYKPLVDSLYYSTSLYLSDSIETEENTATTMMIVVCCAVFLMLLDFFMIFKPIMNGLFQDEKITGLILRLIPTHLIDQQEISGGTDERGTKVSDMVTEMSPIPLIAIDHNGIIAKFSQNAVRECFQYQAVELTGTNLKILMPEEFACKHDQYLAHYRRTRIKKIIDRARIVRGRRKDGEEFPAEVMVRQFKCLGEDMYIGFIRDLTSDVTLRSNARQNLLIREMNRSCVINVDPMGTILMVNKAVTTDFGYQPEELIGENIKVIMPPSVAVMHDTYLENYRNTGKRNILGIMLSSTAQKKNGDLFSIQLKAEVIDCDPPEFIGFIRNTVTEAKLRVQDDVNSGIVHNFPTSCVLIDQIGTIMKFGRAAERDFGYSAKSAVGQNIKILMPLSIANQHDSYLATYAKTRVRRVIGSSRNVEGKHRDGGVFPIRITVAEVENKTLGSNAYIGFMEDMTQQNLVRMNQDVNRVVFEQSCEPIIVIDSVGTVLQINNQALNSFGYEKDEVLDKNLKMLMPPHIANLHDGYLESYRRTGITKVINSTLRVIARRKTGDDLHLSLRVTEIEVSGKTCFCGFARDLTEEIKGQVTFKNNEAIMQISAEGVVVIDRFGIIMRFNEQAQKIWGYSEVEMVGANVSELCPLTHAEKHDGYLVAYAKTGIKHVIDAKTKVDTVKKGGMEFQTNLRVKELKTDNGNYFVGFTADAMMEAKVHLQSETYSEIRKAIPICWLTCDTYGTIKNYGAKAAEQFQYSEEEALGKNVSMLTPPEIASKHDGYLKRYRVSGFNRIGPEGTKVKTKRKDGTLIDIHLNMDSLSIPTATGTTDEFIIAFAVDITDLLSYQESIKNINKIVDVSFNGIIVIDSVGTILKFSQAATKLFGYSEKEVISKNVKILMGEPHKSQHDGYLNAYKRTGVAKVVGTSVLVEGRSKTGDIVPVILSLVQISLNGESIFMGSVVDASAQRRALLHHSKNKVATELSTSAVITADTKGTILRANSSTCKLFGYKQEELIGANVKILTPIEISENHDEYLKRYLKTRKSKVMGTSTELKGMDKWGNNFPLELRLNEIEKADENIYIAYIRDLREEEHQKTKRLIQDMEVHLSADALIGIDDIGTVTLFTKSAEQLSGYTADEVVGKNIKMLMPDEIAEKHDGYLEAYRRTRIKTVVNTDYTVYVKHKNGNVTTVSSIIREIINDDESYSFVGFLCDNSMFEEAKHKGMLGDCILMNCPVAMISINEMGIIQQFNHAAEQEFGYNASVAVGKNVKIIMPDEVAVKHDGYLKAYRETKVAKILGSTQRLTGMTAARERIPISLSVVAVKVGNSDEERFVSFVESLAENLLMEYTESLVTSMIQNCPTPLVVADQYGLIERFSGSAGELFEHDQTIIGKNVSLLMPEEIALKHDGYLKRYKMTGVARVIGKTTRGLNGVTASGREFPVQLSVKELKKEGRESTFVACILDITEIAEIEHEVEAGKAITNASIMPLIAIRSDGICRCYSQSAAELFGYTESDVVGQNIKKLMPTETAEKHDGYLERYQKTRVKRVIDTTRQVTAKHKSGYNIEVLLKVKELTVEGSTIYVSYITDLTVKLNLAWESKLHDTLISVTKDPVIMINTESKMVSINKATAEVFQFEREQLINRHVKLLMPDTTSARHDSYVAVYLRSRKAEPLNVQRYVTAERKDGTHVRALIHIIEIRLSGGEIRFLSKMQIQN